MIRVVASNSPAEVAWEAFDAAAIRFHMLYCAAADSDLDDHPEARAARFKAAQEVSRLWDEFNKLFLGDDEPRPAA